MAKRLGRRIGAIVLSGIFVIFAQYAFGDTPTGVYRGEWRSGSTGHHGPMRAVVQPRADGSYQARFSGRFALIIPFTYKVALQPTYDEFGNSILTAEKPLGPILGSYRMTAQAGGNGLHGSFQAVGDNGSIEMRRIR